MKEDSGGLKKQLIQTSRDLEQLQKETLCIKHRLSLLDYQAPQKKNRRTADKVNRGFICPYLCGKSYGSDISLNLHIRLKHNGGSKIQREELAQRMLLSLAKQEPMPEHNLNLPPKFLEQFCQHYSQFAKELELTYNTSIDILLK
ncbi:hypothetical protein pb186bvf_008572 [Paramecium bursaria]